MFCLAANFNAPHNNTPMLGVHARESGLARVFEMDDQSFRLGDHGRYVPLVSAQKNFANCVTDSKVLRLY